MTDPPHECVFTGWTSERVETTSIAGTVVRYQLCRVCPMCGAKEIA